MEWSLIVLVRDGEISKIAWGSIIIRWDIIPAQNTN